MAFNKLSTRASIGFPPRQTLGQSLKYVSKRSQASTGIAKNTNVRNCDGNPADGKFDHVSFDSGTYPDSGGTRESLWS
jgi:hypothetical protein